MYVVGGLIVGNPEDTQESIEANLAFARRYVDWPYIQHPTPYPRTPMTEHFRERGLITNERLEEYDGTTAVVRTEHLPAEEIEYLRWKAERWMKVRHMPAAFWHDPWFVVRHAPEMLAQTFRGCTLRSVLGLEDDRKTFDTTPRAGVRMRAPIDVCFKCLAQPVFVEADYFRLARYSGATRSEKPTRRERYLRIRSG